jgi:bleomycin hydrolase
MTSCYQFKFPLFQKYGVVPSTVYPESYASSHSSGLNKLLTSKLKAHALEIYALHASLTSASNVAEPSTSTLPAKPSSRESIVQALRAKKEELLTEIWSIMTATLGVPPRPDVPFTYQYYDKHRNARSWTGTPVEFYKSFRSKKYHVSTDCWNLLGFMLIVLHLQPGKWVQISNDPRYPYKAFYRTKKPAKSLYGHPSLKPCTVTFTRILLRR